MSPPTDRAPASPPSPAQPSAPPPASPRRAAWPWRLPWVALAFVALLTASWLALFGLPWTTAWVVVAGLWTVAPARGRPALRPLRGVVAVALLVVAAVWIQVPLTEYRVRVDTLASRVARGPEQLGTRDRLAIYGLNVAMGLGGLALGFPEAGRETLAKAVPGADVRRFSSRSRFAMRSPRVRREVRAMAEAARSQPAGIERIEFEPREIRWGRYDLDVDSVRVALALDNPLLLDGHAERLGDGWRLHLRARATTHYPRRGRLVLLQDRRGHDVVIDESLFWALQELGWLHEFTAEWRWSTDAADPWLDDLETPRLGWREQVLVLIDRGLS